LDWDGKPIPYWLWKLHGLGVRFSCEICGNHDYMGRKAFDQHFFEWRHSNGMKALGIPNTKHFFQITQVEEAQACTVICYLRLLICLVWDKLKQASRTENFRPEAMEEFEDHLGNVYNRKTYEDLRRQGLI
jgi:splicing factor 3A subunit 3